MKAVQEAFKNLALVVLIKTADVVKKDSLTAMYELMVDDLAKKIVEYENEQTKEKQ